MRLKHDFLASFGRVAKTLAMSTRYLSHGPVGDHREIPCKRVSSPSRHVIAAEPLTWPRLHVEMC
jgi:hypothetical protein